MYIIFSVYDNELIIAEGKQAIAENAANFNKEASRKYNKLLPEEKEKIKKVTEVSVKMRSSDVLREAAKIFQKIQKLVSCRVTPLYSAAVYLN